MNKSKFTLTAFITLVILSSIFTVTDLNTPSIHQVSGSSPSQTQLDNAASYLLSMYNPILGLLANSEDEGPNPDPDPVPCNRTYWVYSDNLWAGYALQPFYPEIAENITTTVQQYVAELGLPWLFEVCIGDPIPIDIHDGVDIKVFDGDVSGIRVQVLLDSHHLEGNQSLFYDVEEYADLCFYKTINYWIMNETDSALDWFRIGEGMWNYTTNKGFYDKATRQEELYQNYKLGLFLLAQRITEFNSNITEDVEATAWSYQNDLGGITSLSWLNGSIYGTANAEATTALLLAYNEDLVSLLQDRMAPIISIISPEEGSEIKSSEITITWSGSDALSGINHYEIQLNEEPWSNVGTAISHVFSSITDGSHTFSIKAVDNAGNSQIEQGNFTINTSFIGGPGWIEEIVLIGGIGIALVSVFIFLRVKSSKHSIWR